MTEEEIANLMRMDVACWDGTRMLWYSYENADDPFDRSRFVRFECPLPRLGRSGPYHLIARVGDAIIPRNRFETFREAFEFATTSGVFMPSVHFAEIEAHFKLKRVLESVEDESDEHLELLIEQLEPLVDVARRPSPCP